ncbi:hypothetical protein GCM10027425_31410 [Alteromonas gracilis]
MHARTSRRTVIRSVAWGVPAVVAVSAAPAFAASGAAYSVAAQRRDGKLRLTISSSPSNQTITGISVIYGGSSRSGSTNGDNTTTLVWTSNSNVPNNQSGTVTFIAGGSTVTLSFSVT